MSASDLHERAVAQRTVWTACAFDALTAKIVEAAGFDAVTSSGYGIAASLLGQPDLELYSMSENLGVVRNMASATSLPLIADIDNGYGGVLNVMRTVREFEAAGAQAVFMEDQLSPKKCPQLGTALPLVPLEEAVSKVRAAVAARRNRRTTIIARTDAVRLDEVVLRAKAYVAAGAHLIMPIGKAIRGIDDLRELRTACGVPLVLPVNKGGPLDCSRSELESVAGVVMYPLAGLMTAVQAVKDNLSELQRTKSFDALPHPMMSVPEFQAFIGFPELEATRAKFDTTSAH